MRGYVLIDGDDVIKVFVMVMDFVWCVWDGEILGDDFVVVLLMWWFEL